MKLGQEQEDLELVIGDFDLIEMKPQRGFGVGQLVTFLSESHGINKIKLRYFTTTKESWGSRDKRKSKILVAEYETERKTRNRSIFKILLRTN